MTTINPYDCMRKAQDSIAAADLLASKGFYEIATSRAYYAMFYAAQGLAYSKLPPSLPHLAGNSQKPANSIPNCTDT